MRHSPKPLIVCGPLLLNLGIFAETVENCSKWLELSELKRFRHAQIDSETLRQIWIFDPDPTGFDSDLPEPGEPLYRFDVLKIGKGMGFPGESGREQLLSPPHQRDQKRRK